MEIFEKEVYFHFWCPKCRNSGTKETDMPCNECLAYPFNIHSHKPIHFNTEEDSNGRKNSKGCPRRNEPGSGC